MSNRNTVAALTEKLHQHMLVWGGMSGDWCVGISNNASNRLVQHGATADATHAVWLQAASEDDARTIEDYFLQCGLVGGPGGGNPDDPPDQVYVYKITEDTDP